MTPPGDAVARICLAISSFRSDGAVVKLLEQAAAPGAPWQRIVVVDSLGSGAIGRFIDERGVGARVSYVNHDTNLGSAGNLAARLSWAAAEGFDFVYAINHDGVADARIVRALVDFAVTKERHRLGAVYPLRRYTEHGSTFDMTGRYRLPMPYVGSKRAPDVDAFPVHWASSNGALYVLDRVREGLLPWADFFMGWEDLAYGWLLQERGFEQWVVTAALVDDDYEYRRVRGAPITVSDKPVWYAYYVARNLILAARRTRKDVAVAAMIGARIAAECGLTVAFRESSRERLRLIARGVRDGLRGVAGVGPLPGSANVPANGRARG